jgi:CO/xanthine dehydrogenase FAD-binding subunit
MRSYVPEYELLAATSLSHALQLLSSGENWRPIAGGSDLMVLFNAGKLPFHKLFSIRELNELRGIAVESGRVVLGAAVTYTQIRRSELLQAEFPLLVTAASWTGGIANQNRGTLGGNIANASPAADSAPALLAYDAQLRVASSKGERLIPYHEFHTGYKRMQMRPEELLLEIHLPRPVSNLRHYSRKVGTRKAQAISKVSLAAVAVLERGLIQHIRIAAGSVAPVPLRCHRAEALLSGNALDHELIRQARSVLENEISPISDIRSSGVYRSQVAANLLDEFLQSLL